MDLVILIGLQAAGKSTFARTYFATIHTYVSKDLLRNNRRPARRQAELIEQALQAGNSVVVDNTNATVADRATLVALGRQYNAQIIGYYFEVQVNRSIERNKQRSGKDRVPDIAIFTTLKRLIRPVYEEGFAKLYVVRSDDHFTFEVADWSEAGIPPQE